MQTSDRDAYEHWLETNRQLHRANLAFAAGVERALSEAHLLSLARDVGQLQEDESEALKALCVLRANRPGRLSALGFAIAQDRVRVSNSVNGRLTLGG